MKNLFKSVLLALSVAASGAVLADPPPANPNPGDTYIDTHNTCYVDVCFYDRFFYRWIIMNGYGMWELYYSEMEVRDRLHRLQ